MIIQTDHIEAVFCKYVVRLLFEDGLKCKSKYETKNARTFLYLVSNFLFFDIAWLRSSLAMPGA